MRRIPKPPPELLDLLHAEEDDEQGRWLKERGVKGGQGRSGEALIESGRGIGLAVLIFLGGVAGYLIRRWFCS